MSRTINQFQIEADDLGGFQPIKVTSPIDMKVFSEDKYEKVLKSFEEQFKESPKGNRYYCLLSHYALNKKQMEEIQKLYKLSGWDCVSVMQEGDEATKLIVYMN